MGQAAKREGFEPEIADTSSAATVYSKIQNNMGVVFVAELRMARFNQMSKFMPIDIQIEIYVCWVYDSQREMKQALFEKLLAGLEQP